MSNLVTARTADNGDTILRLDGMARAGLAEMLEMLDLDAFALMPEDKEVLVETKTQVMTALGYAV